MPAATRAHARAVLALGLVLGGCGGELPPRIALVTLDTLRWDDFAGGEGRASAMPSTLARAQRGALFARFHAASNSTQPSHASLFTGLQPWEHGVVRNGLLLAPEQETVAEVLSAAGWSTAAVVASFPLTRRMGFAQGFGSYADRFDLRMGKSWNDVPVDEFYSLARDVTDRALAALDALPPRSPQLLWVHYFDPHAPYGDAAGEEPLLFPKLEAAAAAAGARGWRAPVERARELYRADLAALDRELERLFARLAADAERRETHVVVVADHGESFGDDLSLGHGARLSPAQVHVPLFVLSPRFRPGTRDDPAGSVDVAATLLALGGRPGRAPGGRDLALEPPGDAVAWGMSSEHEGREERLLDGRRLALAPRRFFAAGSGGLLAWDGRAVHVDDDPERPVGDGEAARLAELFRGFAAAARTAPEVAGAEAQEGLSALGYAE